MDAHDTTKLRPATPGDATMLAELVNHAGEGMPLYLWHQMAERGEAPWDVVAPPRLT